MAPEAAATRSGPAEAQLRALTRAFMRLYAGARDDHKVLLNELDNLAPGARAEVIGKQRAIIATAEKYIAAHRSGWKNEKHAAQWESTIRMYVNPVIGKRPVDQIDVEDVLATIEAWRPRGDIALGTYRAQDWTDYRGSPAVNNSSTVVCSSSATPGTSRRSMGRSSTSFAHTRSTRRRRTTCRRAFTSTITTRTA